MFPIGDEDIRGSRPAWVTWLLIGANVVVFVFELTIPRGQLESFFTTYGVVPAQILQGQNLQSLITSMFLHGGWFHILGNMLFLGIFGDNIEAVLGKFKYLLFYLAGGVAASAVYIFFNPSSQAPTLGASGAVAAVLGAYTVMFPKSKVKVLVILGFFIQVTWVAALIFVGVWFVIQLFSSLASLGAATAQSGGGVAYFAHVGGFVFGLLIGLLMRSGTSARERRLIRNGE